MHSLAYKILSFSANSVSQVSIANGREADFALFISSQCLSVSKIAIIRSEPKLSKVDKQIILFSFPNVTLESVANGWQRP